MERYLQWGVDPDVYRTADRHQHTALHAAAHRGRLAVVEALLRNGSDIRMSSGLGDTALHLACEAGHLSVLQELLQTITMQQIHSTYHTKWRPLRTHLEASNIQGYTPLHLAALNGHSRVVDGLLRDGANPQTRSHTGATPMHLAATGGHVQVVKTLIEAGAPVAVQNIFDDTPVHEAAYWGQLEVLKILLKSKDGPSCLHMRGTEDLTPLAQAEEGGHTTIAHFIARWTDFTTLI